MDAAVEPADPAWRELVREGKAHGAVLLSGADDPHAEWLAMIWGPRFDREHALDWWARLSRRRPADAIPVLPVLLWAADRFDGLPAAAQHRLRRLLVRHRAGQALPVTE